MTDFDFDEEQQMDFLFAEARLGVQVEQWLATEIGRYVKGRALNELAEIQRKILEMPGWRDHSAAQLQQQAKMLQMLMGWLTEAVNNGMASEQALREIETETE